MDRQKKLLIIAASWISAGLLSWFLYARTVAPQQEKQVLVAVAAHDMQLGTLLKTADVKMVKYPERDIPRGVVLEAKDAVNRVLLFPVSSNELLLMSKLSVTTSVEGVPSTITPGYRAVSVQITDVSGVAGLIQANSLVDVLFTRPGTMAEATTSTILQHVKVLSTGRLAQTGQPADPRTPKSPVVTLLLTPEDAQKLELAKNEGRISLSLRNPLDATESEDHGPLTTEVLDPMGISRAKRNRGPDPNDAKILRDLTTKVNTEELKKKEPEKPRVVVDVYRGDKHVQESFK
ncbi:MAG TPA: Flp pilus assembly protein CpaB [Bryobacteraceae bacterium]|nr:Flp pilus assembly protein CpaB [Bryobacteraceae bacterium]